MSTKHCAQRWKSVRINNPSNKELSKSIRNTARTQVWRLQVDWYDLSLVVVTSRSGPTPSVFNPFDLWMCFAPQRLALYEHLNFQECSDTEVFLTFWLRHVLRATAACNFWSLIPRDGSTPAALATRLFDPAELQNIGKHNVLQLFYLFAHVDLLSTDSFLWLLFWLFLFSDCSPLTVAASVHKSEVWLLKLPWIRGYCNYHGTSMMGILDILGSSGFAARQPCSGWDVSPNLAVDP